jgi:transcriptional regulator with XRE-family HTH domain
MELKFKIKKLAEQKGLSYPEIGRMTNCHLMTIHNWANLKKGQSQSPPADKLKELADIFQVKMEDLYEN